MECAWKPAKRGPASVPATPGPAHLQLQLQQQLQPAAAAVNSSWKCIFHALIFHF